MARRPQRRALCIHRSYEVAELAADMGIDKRTVRRWISGGLPAIRDRKPILLLGADVTDYLKRKRRRKIRCAEGQFPCFRCHAPRGPAFGEAEIANRSATSLNLRALCVVCSAVMHRRVSLRFLARDMPKIVVRDPEA
jgi:excisionase family DNA binding protein